MDYVVVGSGPCGASLSYLLSKHNYNVTLIERDSQLGGSWNSQWIDGKYWSENAPRVLTASALGNFHNNFINRITFWFIKAWFFSNSQT